MKKLRTNLKKEDIALVKGFIKCYRVDCKHLRISRCLFYTLKLRNNFQIVF